MPHQDVSKNAMLTAFSNDVDTLSLHTSYSASGANEVSGGSYARQTITWNAPSAGALDSSNAPSFSVPSGTTVEYVGKYDATGPTFYGMEPLGNSTNFAAYLDSTNNEVHADNHGLANDDRVAFFGPNVPAGVTVGQLYFVITSATDSFQIATSSGGAAVTWASDGAGQAQDGTPETFSNAGTLDITDFDETLNLLT